MSELKSLPPDIVKYLNGTLFSWIQFGKIITFLDNDTPKKYKRKIQFKFCFIVKKIFIIKISGIEIGLQQIVWCIFNSQDVTLMGILLNIYNRNEKRCIHFENLKSFCIYWNQHQSSFWVELNKKRSGVGWFHESHGLLEVLN